jgi:integrase/recombinase XerD
MTILAPVLEAFFTDRLMTQRLASPHTVAAYRDPFTLLLGVGGHGILNADGQVSER